MEGDKEKRNKFDKKEANVLEISKFFLPLHPQTRDMYPREKFRSSS